MVAVAVAAIAESDLNPVLQRNRIGLRDANSGRHGGRHDREIPAYELRPHQCIEVRVRQVRREAGLAGDRIQRDPAQRAGQPEQARSLFDDLDDIAGLETEVRIIDRALQDNTVVGIAYQRGHDAAALTRPFEGRRGAVAAVVNRHAIELILQRPITGFRRQFAILVGHGDNSQTCRQSAGRWLPGSHIQGRAGLLGRAHLIGGDPEFGEHRHFDAPAQPGANGILDAPEGLFLEPRIIKGVHRLVPDLQKGKTHLAELRQPLGERRQPDPGELIREPDGGLIANMFAGDEKRARADGDAAIASCRNGKTLVFMRGAPAAQGRLRHRRDGVTRDLTLLVECGIEQRRALLQAHADVVLPQCVRRRVTTVIAQHG